MQRAWRLLGPSCQAPLPLSVELLQVIVGVQSKSNLRLNNRTRRSCGRISDAGVGVFLVLSGDGGGGFDMRPLEQTHKIDEQRTQEEQRAQGFLIRVTVGVDKILITDVASRSWKYPISLEFTS